MPAGIRKTKQLHNKFLEEASMPDGELVDTIHTKYNKWTIYKVRTFMSAEFHAYKNGNYSFMAKDLRWVVDEINQRDR